MILIAGRCCRGCRGCRAGRTAAALLSALAAAAIAGCTREQPPNWATTIGWTIDNVSDGPQIIAVQAGSLADRLGLHAHDRIIGLNRTRVNTSAAVDSALRSAFPRNVTMQISRDSIVTELLLPLRQEIRDTVTRPPEGRRHCAAFRLNASGRTLGETGCAVATRAYCNGCRRT
ncbi:MAG TPA: PDZ domain-containing protein [Gemmatimonadaceae bacterium]|nr:PDZ domain-containing protein [Gemmatimonadaceae bacterium]